MELDLEVFFTGQDTPDMPVYNRLYTLLEGRRLLIDRFTGVSNGNVAGGLNLVYPRTPINIKYIRTAGGGNCYYITKQIAYQSRNNKQPQCYPDVAGIIAELYGDDLITDNISNGWCGYIMRNVSSNMTRKNSRTHNSRLVSRAASVITTENPGYNRYSLKGRKINRLLSHVTAMTQPGI